MAKKRWYHVGALPEGEMVSLKLVLTDKTSFRHSAATWERDDIAYSCELCWLKLYEKPQV